MFVKMCLFASLAKFEVVMLHLTLTCVNLRL